MNLKYEKEQGSRQALDSLGVSGWSQKIYLELEPPCEEDNASDQERIVRALREEFGEISCSLSVLRNLYPVCSSAQWKITLLLVWTGTQWELADIEAGDQTGKHYGLCADLGSTTLAVELVDMNTGAVLCQKSGSNKTDSLWRRYSYPDFLFQGQQGKIRRNQTGYSEQLSRFI